MGVQQIPLGVTDTSCLLHSSTNNCRSFNTCTGFLQSSIWWCTLHDALDLSPMKVCMICSLLSYVTQYASFFCVFLGVADAKRKHEKIFFDFTEIDYHAELLHTLNLYYYWSWTCALDERAQRCDSVACVPPARVATQSRSVAQQFSAPSLVRHVCLSLLTSVSTLHPFL